MDDSWWQLDLEQPEFLTPYHICPSDDSDDIIWPFEFAPVYFDSSGELGNFRIFVDGNLMQAAMPRGYGSSDVSPRKAAPRGQVQGFSSASRRRLMRYVATLDSSVIPLFVTLTYPAEFDRSYTVWKNDLHKFARRFATKYKNGGFIWRLEPQKRGAPHYHLLVYGVQDKEEFKVWCAKAWDGCVDSDDPKHLLYGSHVEVLRSARGTRCYVSKYIAKIQVPSGATSVLPEDGSEVVDWNTVGRWWGVRYAGNLPKSECLGGTALTKLESQRLLRTMRRYLKSKGVQVSGVLRALTMFVESPREWVRCLDGITREVNVGNGSFLDIGRGVQLS